MDEKNQIKQTNKSFPMQKWSFFPISCILALIFPVVIKYFPKCEGKGSFLKSRIKSLTTTSTTATTTTTTTTATANTGNVKWSFSPLQGFIYDMISNK